MIQNIVGKKYDNINGLRTFACLAIIAWHVMANSAFQLNAFMSGRIIPSWNYLVYLFMIISGFGMCNSYYDRVKSGSYDLNAFYLKRYQKNLPFFALVILLDLLIEHNAEALYEGVMEITMLFGFLPNNKLDVIGVAWTLGVIFAFYIIFPYFVFLLYNKRRAWFSFAVSLIIIYMCQIYFMTDKFVVATFEPRRSLLFCLPYFIAGGLIYLYKEEIVILMKGRNGICGITCILLTVAYYCVSDEVNGFDLVAYKALVLYSIWFCCAIACKSKLMNNCFTKRISEYSMEMYLGHMVVFRVIQKLHLEKYFASGCMGYLVTYVSVVVLLVAGIAVYKRMISYVQAMISRRRII